MSAALLTSLEDVYYGLEAAVNWAAATDAELLSMVDYIYDGFGMMNYHNVHAMLHSSTLTDTLARTMRIFACSCAFVEYLSCSVGRLAL